MSCQQVPTTPALNPYPRSVQVGEFEVAIDGGIWVAIRAPYAQAFRDQMVELVRSGRTPSALSKEFGCHTTSILSWVRQAGGAGATALPASAAALNAQERQELIELRRKLRQVQMERDILAKATAWFAGKSEKTSTPSTNS